VSSGRVEYVMRCTVPIVRLRGVSPSSVVSHHRGIRGLILEMRAGAMNRDIAGASAYVGIKGDTSRAPTLS